MKPKPIVVLAVRDMNTWELLAWIEETHQKGLLGWLKRKLGLHRKTFKRTP